MGQGVQNSHFVNNGSLHELYHSETKWEGEFSIYWAGSTQYSVKAIGFNGLNKDMSQLVNYIWLHVLCKGIEPTSFDLGFIHTKKSDT